MKLRFLLTLCTLALPLGQLAASNFTVTNTNDLGAGSLRAAITSANGDASPPHTITITATGTISLATALPTINRNTTINGPGSSSLTVQRSTAGGTGNFAVFEVANGNTANFSGMTVSNGVASLGAGIYLNNNAISSISRVVVSGNSGSGIYADNNSSLTLIESTVTGNTGAPGIFADNGSSVSITRSTVSFNTNAAGNGGGILNSSGIVTLTNSTVAGNTASGDGGGIDNQSGTFNLYNSTVAANSAGSVTGLGGGIFYSGGSINLLNTIVAANSASSGRDVSSTSNFSSLGHNLISRTDGSAGGWAGSDLTGTNASPLSAQLGALANNGGPTKTMALQSDSPAKNAGDDAVLSPPYSLTTDQRGTGFSRSFGSHVDIGAFEINASDAALPVELTDFAVASDMQQVKVTWRTASEVRNAGFEVQRSIGDEEGFVSIVSYLTDPTLVGEGTSSRGRDYSYADREVQPATTYYYRLVDVSTDGVRTPHDAKRIETAPLSTGHLTLKSVVPTPTAGNATIGFHLPGAGTATIRLVSLDGMELATLVDNKAYAAGDQTETFDLSRVTPGVYFVKLTAGSEIRTMRMIVVR
jgi:hypothetical protein